MRLQILEQLNAARSRAEPIVLVTNLDSGEQLIWREGAQSESLDAACRRALDEERPRRLELEGRAYFLHPFLPSRRVVVVGAVHIAKALVSLIVQGGDQPVVVDPREAFARSDRFPGISLSTDWPDEYLERAPLSARDALVTLTHDPKLDDPALESALRSEAHYIGALGSRKSHADRRDRLRRRGFSEESLDRIHGPVGLPIGGRSPFEISVSIAAQMIEVRRR
ncbi:MAG: XdhC family protein [Myxococcota bacterium]